MVGTNFVPTKNKKVATFVCVMQGRNKKPPDTSRNFHILDNI